ncbi:MAG: VWA domain-containing protein [Verrucomicrobiota bacterium]
MPLEILRPWVLLTLAGLLWIWYLNRDAVALFTVSRRRMALWIRGFLLVLVALSLSDPRWRMEMSREHVVWLVDASRSMDEEAVKRYQQLVEDEDWQRAAIDQSVILFGGKAQVVPHSGEIDQFVRAELEDTRTSLSGALDFANANFPAGYNRTVVMLTDGLETEGDVTAKITALRQRDDLKVHVVPVEPPDRPEVLVRQIKAPRMVAQREPVGIIAEVFSNRKGQGTLKFFRNGIRIAFEQVELQSGLNRFSINHASGDDKLSEFTASIEADFDTIMDNNQASAVVQTAGQSRVLLLSDKPERSRYLGQALKQEGIRLEIRPPAGAPADLADLQNYDLLILDNVAATDMDPLQLNMIASFTRDMGGGFMMLGGDQSFGLGGYYRTPIEDILPVRCDFEKEKEAPSLGLALVIDRSGSMSGMKMEMAKDAAKAAVELLGPRDFTGVVAFDHEGFWVADFQSASDTAGIQQRIASLDAGGGTNIAAGMELAYAKLGQSPAKIKHMIVLTDGVSTPGPFQQLTVQMASESITVSTVALGSGADQELLKRISEWGNGRYYFTDTPNNIPQIFAKETMTASKSALQETPFVAMPVKSADFLEGVDFASSPFLLGYVITRLKPTAEHWLATERGDPLLVSWRYGLGQSAAFTSDARNRWGVEWLKWEAFSRFWAQTVRRMARPDSLKSYPVQVIPVTGGFEVVVDVPDLEGGFLAGLSGEMILADAEGGGARTRLENRKTGQLVGYIPAQVSGHYHAQLMLQQNGKALDHTYVVATLPYPAEFLMQQPDPDALRGMASVAGGFYDPTISELLRKDERKSVMMLELWPWLTGLALIVFIADVAFRRWPEKTAAA